jgi:hypothetical protein
MPQSSSFQSAPRCKDWLLIATVATLDWMEGPMEAHIGVEMRRAIAEQSCYVFLCLPMSSYVFLCLPMSLVAVTSRWLQKSKYVWVTSKCCAKTYASVLSKRVAEMLGFSVLAMSGHFTSRQQVASQTKRPELNTGWHWAQKLCLLVPDGTSIIPASEYQYHIEIYWVHMASVLNSVYIYHVISVCYYTPMDGQMQAS